MLDEGYSADQAILGELVNEPVKVNGIDKAFQIHLRLLKPICHFEDYQYSNCCIMQDK